MNPRISNWTNQRVWVIGASSGIGAATASNLLKRGAKVCLSARNAEAMQQIAAGHKDSLVVPLDITDAAAVQRAHDELLASWGGLDLILIVAGSYQKMRADDFDINRS